MKFWLVNEKYVSMEGERNYFCNDSIKVSELGTELEIGIDCKLKFKDFINTLCGKAAKKTGDTSKNSHTLCKKENEKSPFTV